jgi:Glycosyltransferase sugar-binding region containing DXD motif
MIRMKVILYALMVVLLLITSCRQGLRASATCFLSLSDGSRPLEAESSLAFIYEYLGTIQNTSKSINSSFDELEQIIIRSPHHHNTSSLVRLNHVAVVRPGSASSETINKKEANQTTNTNSNSSSNRIVGNYTSSSVTILPSNYIPSSPCVFLIWRGSATLPPMYELGLQSAIRAFGSENIVIVSTDLVAIIDCYPPVRIWNISSHDLAARVTDIHPLHVWERFFQQIQHPAHFADFQRIALLYLYGGLYTDIDALWLRAPPFVFPVVMAAGRRGGRGRNGNKQQWQDKSLLRVVDRDRRGRTGIPSNGVIGGIANATYFRQILHLMPLHFKPRKWTGIGGSLLKTSYDMLCNKNNTNPQPNCSDDFIEISRPNMYGCMYETAKEMDLYGRALSDSSPRDQDLKKHVLSHAYQLHIFGSSIVSKGNITSSSSPEPSKVHPASGSLYDVVLKQLNLSLPT